MSRQVCSLKSNVMIEKNEHRKMIDNRKKSKCICTYFFVVTREKIDRIEKKKHGKMIENREIQMYLCIFVCQDRE